MNKKLKHLSLGLMAVGVLGLAGYGLYAIGMKQGMDMDMTMPAAAGASATASPVGASEAVPQTIAQGEEATRRLVAFYNPVRIYLFGSEARGEAGPDSDLDFLVVVPDDIPETVFRSRAVYTHLSGLGLPKDVVPWRMSDFDGRAAHVTASLPAAVLREGRLLYESR